MIFFILTIFSNFCRIPPSTRTSWSYFSRTSPLFWGVTEPRLNFIPSRQRGDEKLPRCVNYADWLISILNYFDIIISPHTHSPQSQVNKIKRVKVVAEIERQSWEKHNLSCVIFFRQFHAADRRGALGWNLRQSFWCRGAWSPRPIDLA